VRGMFALSLPFRVSIFGWWALEVVLLVRDLVRRQGRRGRDRGTRVIVALSIGCAIVIGWLMRGWVPTAGMPVADAFAAAGVVVIWAGLALRVWAVLALGGSFRTFVEVDTDQAVVTRGPYRWVRHPSYSGLLLIALGFGLGAGNWLSVVICGVVPVLGLLPRIAVEESEMVWVLGDQYRGYQRTTHRLVPGLW
jgi:protein-S-isoprenylcysteine O-methyltransferase Ste14